MNPIRQRTPLRRFSTLLLALVLSLALLTSTAFAAQGNDQNSDSSALADATTAAPETPEALDSEQNLDQDAQNPDLLGQNPDIANQDQNVGVSEDGIDPVDGPPQDTTTAPLPATTSRTVSTPFTAGMTIVDEAGAIVTRLQPGHTYTLHVLICNTSTVDVEGAAIALKQPNRTTISEKDSMTYSVSIYGDNIRHYSGMSETNYQTVNLAAISAEQGSGKVVCAYNAGSARLITPSQPGGVSLPDLELLNRLGTTSGFVSSDGVFAAGRENSHELTFEISTTSAEPEDDKQNSGNATDGASSGDADGNSAGSSDGVDTKTNPSETRGQQSSSGNIASGTAKSTVSGLEIFGFALVLIILLLILVAVFLLNCQIHLFNRDFREHCRQQGVELPPQALPLFLRKAEPATANAAIPPTEENDDAE